MSLRTEVNKNREVDKKEFKLSPQEARNELNEKRTNIQEQCIEQKESCEAAEIQISIINEGIGFKPNHVKDGLNEQQEVIDYSLDSMILKDGAAEHEGNLNHVKDGLNEQQEVIDNSLDSMILKDGAAEHEGNLVIERVITNDIGIPGNEPVETTYVNAEHEGRPKVKDGVIIGNVCNLNVGQKVECTDQMSDNWNGVGKKIDVWKLSKEANLVTKLKKRSKGKKRLRLGRKKVRCMNSMVKKRYNGKEKIEFSGDNQVLWGCHKLSCKGVNGHSGTRNHHDGGIIFDRGKQCRRQKDQKVTRDEKTQNKVKMKSTDSRDDRTHPKTKMKY